ncbi:hypothetical protein DBB29_01485 [Pandoraea cepalis]|uniref:Uncharacterized protein n=1 Tax=Pandoraea cepalis TaxID=2508294 RepID=A0AAW7MJ99_9BURK|nr:hypothetical protein [Pandoraea cepalis]MDN4576798.1 hypothetical protein [Pandoraea cepalis]
MSYQVGDNAEPHQSYTKTGARLFIVDRAAATEMVSGLHEVVLYRPHEVRTRCDRRTRQSDASRRLPFIRRLSQIVRWPRLSGQNCLSL